MYMKTEIEQLRKEFNERIDALLKEDKPKFEVGKWYKHKYYCAMFNYNGVDVSKNNYVGYGFTGNHSTNWTDSFYLYVDKHNDYLEAAPEEVKSALVNEAVNRGFKSKTNIKFLSNWNHISSFNDFEMEFIYKDNCLYIYTDYYKIFDNGQWATIIKDDVIKVGGYEVEFCDEWCSTKGRSKYTKIDSNVFTTEFWQSAKIISEHSKAKIMVGCSKQFDVSLETINKILDKL